MSGQQKLFVESLRTNLSYLAIIQFLPVHSEKNLCAQKKINSKIAIRESDSGIRNHAIAGIFSSQGGKRRKGAV
jgi:hypothetical protein